VDDRINRVVPVAKAEGGGDLYLPEIWIDSEYIDEQPVIRMEYLKVQGQVGKDDGTETDTNWTEQALLEEMRRKAQERFDVDHCDAEAESVKIDFVLLGDTEEYRQYRDLETVSMYDRITVTDPRIGMQLQLQVSATEYDAIRRRYKSITVGDVFNYGGRTVSSYQIGDGAIYYEKIAQSTIDRIISEVV
jgi:phage minor structural protein